MAATANNNDARHRIRLITRSPGETAAVAAALAGVLRGGDVVSLEGDLGAGKTLFTGAVARALAAAGPVTSPTFVLQKTYEIADSEIRALVHYDVYRLSAYTELVDIGFEDLDAHSVALVEWGDRFISDYARPPIRVGIIITGGQTRRIVLELDDADRCSRVLEALQNRVMPLLDSQPEPPLG